MQEQNRQSNSHLTKEDEKAGVSRRFFLSSVSAGAVALGATSMMESALGKPAKEEGGLPAGKTLRVQPVLVYAVSTPQEKTSWRPYGAIQSDATAAEEAKRIEGELAEFVKTIEYPVEMLPVATASSEDKIKQAAATDADALLVYAAAGPTEWFQTLAASKAANIMFLRHQSGPHYLWYEIAHWRLLRFNEDAMVEPNMDTGDIVVDKYDEVAWRLRALYGLKNARGTKMLAIGSLAAYSKPGQELGPKHAQDVWGYTIEVVPHEEFKQRLERAKADAAVMQKVMQDAADFLDRPKLKLQTERRFVENSFVAYHVCRELLQEKNAFNFGFDHCMGGDVIGMLDTPPCLVLALANDEGYTAYCHTDLTHTVPGVLLRWISGKPSFVCNTHFPHDGIFTVAHCAAPTKMNGHTPEPTTVMTHYESDYGAATKVEYPKGQELTVVISALNCARWHGFSGTVIDSPSLPACRSQINIKVNGDWKGLLERMEGFHAQIVYGNYLREVGYALKKVKAVEWNNYSAEA